MMGFARRCLQEEHCDYRRGDDYKGDDYKGVYAVHADKEHTLSSDF